MNCDYLILGAGAAGLRAAQVLRDLKPESTVILANGEDRLPYKRTKLSKCLAQGFGTDEFAQFPREWYEDQGILLKSGWWGVKLDSLQKTVTSESGEVLSYGNLLLALGSTPHQHEAPVFREAREAEKLKNQWDAETYIRILGGGILGIELTEQAILMKKKTTLISRSGILMKESLSPELSQRLRRVLAKHGVKLQTGHHENPEYHVTALGSPPRIDLARRAGLTFDLGILVDENFKTSGEGIYAAGDCCQLPDGTVCHLWHQAEDQGEAAARAMAGLSPDFKNRPYRMKLDIFEDYFFSMGKVKGVPLQIREFPSGTTPGLAVYQAWYGTQEGVTGVAVAGDKERAKVYEKAVLENWTLERVLRDLSPI